MEGFPRASCPLITPKTCPSHAMELSLETQRWEGHGAGVNFWESNGSLPARRLTVRHSVCTAE